MNELAARFPNLTVVDVARRGAPGAGRDRPADQTRCSSCSCSRSAPGLLVLYSALVATEDERRREAAVMRVYGASRAQVTGSQRAEFLAMGAARRPARHARRRGDRPAARAARVRARPAAQPRAVDRRPARRPRAAVAQRLALVAQGAARFAGDHVEGIRLTVLIYSMVEILLVRPCWSPR